MSTSYNEQVSVNYVIGPEYQTSMNLGVIKSFKRSIHTCDLLGVNYCVNFSVHAIKRNWYTVHTKVYQIASVNVAA